MHEDRADLTRANLAYIRRRFEGTGNYEKREVIRSIYSPEVSKHAWAIVVSPMPSILRTRIGEIGTWTFAEVPSECRYGGREDRE